MPRTHSVCAVLGIDPLNDYMCNGLARTTGRRCRNSCTLASARTAHNLLSQCANLPADSRQLKKNFETAATLLHCKRWHQDQWRNLYREWIDAWEAYTDSADSGYGSQSDASSGSDLDSEEEDSDEEEQEIRPSHPIRTPTTRRPVGQEDPIVPSSTYEDLVRSILNSDISNDAKVLILQNASRNGTRSISNNAVATHIPSPRTTRSTRSPTGTVTPASNRASSSNTNARTSTTLTGSSNNSNRAIRERALSSRIAQPTTAPSVRRAHSPSEPAPSTRGSHLECVICFESYEVGETALWECRRCQNRLHGSCYDEWDAQDSEVTRCPYCRTPVSPSS